MNAFQYRDGELFCEEVAVTPLAEEFGTPLWIYSKAQLLHQLGQIQEAFSDVEPVICYSVKANSNLAVLNVLSRLGAGFDIVSGGELERVIAAGGEGEFTNPNNPYDVNDDGYVSPFDLLLLINYMKQRREANAAGAQELTG